METELRISILRLSDATHAQDESLVEALRADLHWETVARDTYYALASMLPQGYKILIDHYPNRPIPRSIEEALEAQQEHVQACNERERARKAQLPDSKPKKERKGLTKRQERELETLRQELGQGT